MKRKKLEIMLEGVEKYVSPKSALEQYLTPPTIASDILFLAYSMGDLSGKSVADLGAGTGIFSIGACLLGAKEVYAVEIDKGAVEVLRRNVKKFKCRIKIEEEDVRDFHELVDTVIENPPFGAQNRHADLPFLEKAMEIGRVIYTLHNGVTAEFIENKIREMGGNITHRKVYRFTIPHIYRFHRKEKVEIEVVLYRIEV